MTTSTLCALVLLGSGLLVNCQKKEAIPTRTRESYIIGFHPCTASSPQRGYVLAFPAADTVVTYSLPPDLYDFPAAYFAQYQSFFLFPRAEQQTYKVCVTYYPTPADQVTYPLCTADINLAIYHYFVRNREITVTAAQRANCPFLGWSAGNGRVGRRF